MLRIDKLRLENFRCFDTLDISFEPDITVLFAENGGGKTALLTGLAMALTLLQPQHNKELALNAARDARRIRGADGRWESAGRCSISCVASIGGRPGVEWSVTAYSKARRRTERLGDSFDAIEEVRMPRERWPLLGYYGTGRLACERKSVPKRVGMFLERWEGYEGCLDPATTDGPLLDWLRNEAFGDITRRQRGEAERRFDLGVFNAIKRATPGVADMWYDAALESPMTRFEEGHEVEWAELSDGFHVFMGLIGDIARRAVILNGMDGANAPLLLEGVVMIDEIDLHLHPRWQRVVLKGLREAFPRLQFIVTTHSPQVLSSAKNQQVRRLVDWKLKDNEVFVEGRDSNAILRELMHTDDRDEEGRRALREFYAAIDEERFQQAKELLLQLRGRWGTRDPELIRAGGLLDEEV